MKKVIGYQREALFIRRAQVPPDLRSTLKSDNTVVFYTEKHCNKCEYLQDRHSDICDNCNAFKGRSELYSEVIINDKQYIKLPLGRIDKVQRQFERHDLTLKFKNKHPKPVLSRPIEYTGTFRKWQPNAIDALVEGKRGVLKSKPRSGKTVMCAAAVCRVGLKTLIVASQRDWLDGFHETFVGSSTQKALTTLSKKRIGFCRKLEDFKKYDVCLCTVQTFYSPKGQKLLRQIRDMFGIIICDEAQTTAARIYIQVLAKLNAEYFWVVSGTPSRKDGRFTLVHRVIGKLLHETDVPSLTPSIELAKTNYVQKSYKQGYVPLHWLESGLENNKARLKLIAKHAIQDMKKGHMILIPFRRRKAQASLVALINKLAGEKVAYQFAGGAGQKNYRKDVIDKARRYKVKIIVGTLSLLDKGINIPRASMIYECALSSNKENAEQRISRILTPYKNKPQPTIKLFLDDMGARQKMMRFEYYQVILPKFKPYVSKRDKIVLEEYFKQKEKEELFYGGDVV